MGGLATRHYTTTASYNSQQNHARSRSEGLLHTVIAIETSLRLGLHLHRLFSCRPLPTRHARWPASGTSGDYTCDYGPSSGVAVAALPDHVPPELVHEFDFRTGLGSHPHSAVAALHDGPRVFYSPVHHNAIAGAGTWVLTRAEDIRAALQDAATFSSNVRRSNSGLSLIPLELDAPDHAKFRALMNPIFSPARMKLLDDKVRELARELAAACAAKGHCDFVEDFAKPFPVSIFLDLMGLPKEQMGRFLAWEALIMRTSRRARLPCRK